MSICEILVMCLQSCDRMRLCALHWATKLIRHQLYHFELCIVSNLRAAKAILLFELRDDSGIKSGFTFAVVYAEIDNDEHALDTEDPVVEIHLSNVPTCC